MKSSMFFKAANRDATRRQGPASRDVQLGSHSRILDSSRPLRSLVVLIAYGLSFTALHHAAGLWATDKFFSLWFPAAGLRFALLWVAGPVWSPLLSLAEVISQFVLGEATGPVTVLSLLGMAAPCLAYGLAIQIVRRAFQKRRRSHFVIEHEAMIVAACAGAFLACLTAFPSLIISNMVSGTFDLRQIVVSLLVFSLGDLLGVLTIAIPILWLRRRELKLLYDTRAVVSAHFVELALVYLASWVVVFAIYWVGMGFTLSPILLASCWMSFRAGRIVAWLTFVTTTIITLPVSSLLASDIDRLRAHLLLASIALIGYLVASFAEAEKIARLEIQRRDRLLYQADRLKTLRAMSLAVIHEISQPLSTIALEARGLSSRADSTKMGSEERGAIDLIFRKTNDLSALVTNLRKFGSRPSDEHAEASLAAVVEGAISLAVPEAKRRRILITRPALPNYTVVGHDIELRQALLNLLMNAIAACAAGGLVELDVRKKRRAIEIAVKNDDTRSKSAGMGIGLIIARAIAEASGGAIRDERLEGNRVFTLKLKEARGEADE